MKYSLIYSIVLFFNLSFTAYSNDRENISLDDGIVTFKGGIVEPACTVSSESEYQIVDLGVISSNQFHGVGSHSIKIPFFIKLMGCNKSITDKVSIIIIGDVNNNDKRLFSITDQQNSASGLGVALFNDEGEIIIPNKFNKYKFIEENELKLKFKASYLATKENVIGGKADSVVWFVFNYQ